MASWPPTRDNIARFLGTSSLISGCFMGTDGSNLFITAGEVTFNFLDAAGNLRSTGKVFTPAFVENAPKVETVYYVYLESDLTISYETSLDPRSVTPNATFIYLGGYTVIGGVIQTVSNLTDVSQVNVPEAIRDLQYTIKPLRKKGLEIVPAATPSMRITVLAGQVMTLSGFVKAYSSGGSQNILDVAAQTPLTYFYEYRAGIGGPWIPDPKSELNPTKYDDGSGVLQNVTNKYWTVQRFYATEALALFLSYGQYQYSCYDDAINGLHADPVEKDPLLEFGYFAGYVLIRQDCTDLNDNTKCRFILPDSINGEFNTVTTQLTVAAPAVFKSDGWAKYVSSLGATTLPDNEWTDLSNNAGTGTITQFLPTGVTRFWDTSLNAIVLDESPVGKQFTLQCSFTITPSKNNSKFALRLAWNERDAQGGLVTTSYTTVPPVLFDRGAGVPYEINETLPLAIESSDQQRGEIIVQINPDDDMDIENIFFRVFTV